MHERVALAVTRVLEICHCAESFTCRQENQLDGIIEAAARHPFKTGAVRVHAPDARGFSVKFAAVFGFDVIAVPSVGEIQPTVGTEEGAMETGGIRRKMPAGNDDLALVGHAVTIGVRQADQVWRRGDVQTAAVPHGARRKCELVGENRAAIVDAVALRGIVD